MVGDTAEVLQLREQLARAQSRIRVVESQLQALADHDPLTDLPNRQTMESAIEHHLAGCARYGPEGALLIVGLDGLDGLEARQGPAAGDDLRVRIATAVRDRLRTTDPVCRWAGDELAVLLARSDRHEAQRVAETLVQVIARRGGPDGIAASVGVAFVVADEPVDELVVRTSMAMFAARRSGGSCVVVDAHPTSHPLWPGRSRHRSGNRTAPVA